MHLAVQHLQLAGLRRRSDTVVEKANSIGETRQRRDQAVLGCLRVDQDPARQQQRQVQRQRDGPRQRVFGFVNVTHDRNTSQPSAKNPARNRHGVHVDDVRDEQSARLVPRVAKERKPVVKRVIKPRGDINDLRNTSVSTITTPAPAC